MSYTICSRFKGEHIVYAGYTICTSREHIVYGAFCGSTTHSYLEACQCYQILLITYKMFVCVFSQTNPFVMGIVSKDNQLC